MSLPKVFGLNPERLLLQPARPQFTDVSLAGRHCRGVYIVSSQGPEPIEEVEAQTLAVIDCRALLQGWYAVEAAGDYVPCHEVEQTLSTFAPPAWSLYLERLPREGENFRIYQGTVAFASFVPPSRRSAAAAAELVSAEGEAIVPHEDLDTNMSDAVAVRAGSRCDPAVENGHLDVGVDERLHYGATVLVLAPEYAPEVVRVAFDTSMSVQAAVNAVNSQRDRFARLRFPDVYEARPQPSFDFAVCVATPSWTQDTFVVVDALRLNGTLGCLFVRAAVDRETLLATAGFPAMPTIEVYVPGLPVPLQDRQQVQLSFRRLCILCAPFWAAFCRHRFGRSAPRRHRLARQPRAALPVRFLGSCPHRGGPTTAVGCATSASVSARRAC